MKLIAILFTFAEPFRNYSCTKTVEGGNDAAS